MMDLEELRFVGNTYVYRGPYPRSEPLPPQWGAEKRTRSNGGAGVARFGKTRANDVVAQDEVETYRMSPEERVERGKSRRGEGENRSHPVNPVFGKRGLLQG
jgi:hypothetical protein